MHMAPITIRKRLNMANMAVATFRSAGEGGGHFNGCIYRLNICYCLLTYICQSHLILSIQITKNSSQRLEKNLNITKLNELRIKSNQSLCFPVENSLCFISARVYENLCKCHHRFKVTVCMASNNDSLGNHSFLRHEEPTNDGFYLKVLRSLVRASLSSDTTESPGDGSLETLEHSVGRTDLKHSKIRQWPA